MSASGNNFSADGQLAGELAIELNINSIRRAGALQTDGGATQDGAAFHAIRTPRGSTPRRYCR